MLKPPRVYFHDGRTGALLSEVPSLTYCQLVFNDKEPATARLGLPADSEALHVQRWAPGGFPAFARIDARDLGTVAGESFGLAETWAGKVRCPQGDPLSGTWSMDAVGPSSWLATCPVRTMGSPIATASVIVRRTVDDGSARWVRLAADPYRGLPAGVDLGGQNVWALWEELSTGRGEMFRLIADDDEIGFWLAWSSALTGPRPRPDVTFFAGSRPGTNVVWQPAYDVPDTLDEMTMAAFSMLRGTPLDALVGPAPAPALGRKAGLTAVLSSPVAAAITGGVTSLDLTVTDASALLLAFESQMRAVRIYQMMARAQATQLTPGMFSLRPGDVVNVEFADDPTGIFVRATALILSATFQVWPSLNADFAVQLWEREDD